MKTRTMAALSTAYSYVLLVTLAGALWGQDTKQQKQQQSSKQNQYRDQAQNESQDQSQQTVRTLSGVISQKGNNFVLAEMFHTNSYRLVDTWEAKRYAGKKVRVTGWLDQEHNVLHVKSIDIAP